MGVRGSNNVDSCVPFLSLCDELHGCDITALNFVLIELESQTLRLLNGGSETASYSVSTAANGAGCRENTGCTPLGWHTVDEKIGHGVERGTAFKGRRPGAICTDLCSATDDDTITSRILWLHGSQPGYNSGGSVDSKNRYIYIHGTAQEQLIGQPVSHGCIRMRNDDVIALFDLLDEKTPVLISQMVIDLPGLT